MRWAVLPKQGLKRAKHKYHLTSNDSVVDHKNNILTNITRANKRGILGVALSNDFPLPLKKKEKGTKEKERKAFLFPDGTRFVRVSHRRIVNA